MKKRIIPFVLLASIIASSQPIFADDVLDSNVGENSAAVEASAEESPAVEAPEVIAAETPVTVADTPALTAEGDEEETTPTVTVNANKIKTEEQLRAAATDEVTTSIKLANDITLTSPISIDKDFTIDFCGYEIKDSSSFTQAESNVELGNNMFKLGEYEITFENSDEDDKGKITSTKVAAISCKNTKLTIDKVDVSSTGLSTFVMRHRAAIYEAGTSSEVTIKKDTTVTGEPAILIHDGNSGSLKGKSILTVEGKVVSNNQDKTEGFPAIMGGIQDMGDSTITITSTGEVTGAIAASQYGTITVDGGKVTSENVAIAAQSGKINILNGATIKAGPNGDDTPSTIDGGISSPNNAIYIDSSASSSSDYYSGAVEITIDGENTKLTSTGGSVISEYQGASPTKTNIASLTIKDGTLIAIPTASSDEEEEDEPSNSGGSGSGDSGDSGSSGGDESRTSSVGEDDEELAVIRLGEKTDVYTNKSNDNITLNVATRVISITGGKFSSSIDEKYLGKGYISRQSSEDDGYYIIKKKAEISGITPAEEAYVYDGTAKTGYTGDPTIEDYTGEINKTYYVKAEAEDPDPEDAEAAPTKNFTVGGEEVAYTEIDEAPKNVGEYMLVLETPDDAKVYAEKEIPFEIVKANSDLESEGVIAVYDNTGQNQIKKFAKGDLIIVKVKPEAGDTAYTAPSDIALVSEALASNSVALYKVTDESGSETETLLQSLAQPGDSGYYTFYLDTDTNTFEVGDLKLRVKFAGNDNLGPNQADITLKVEESIISPYGDIDVDNDVDEEDAAALISKVRDKSVCLPIEDYYPAQWKTYADLDGDGEITSTDAALIIKRALDEDFAFPAE